MAQTIIEGTCIHCGTGVKITVDANDALEFFSEGRDRSVQDIFPYLTADEREMLISRTCSACWDRMFGNED